MYHVAALAKISTCFQSLFVPFLEKIDIAVCPNNPIGDFCNRRSIKCNKNNGPSAPCQNCEDFDIPCTYDRPAKRRGVGKNVSPAVSQAMLQVVSGDGTSSSSSHQAYSLRSQVANRPWDTFNNKHTSAVTIGNDGAPLDSWRAFAITCQNTVQDLAQVYFEIVYPMYFVS